MSDVVDLAWPDGTPPGRYDLGESLQLCERVRASFEHADPLARAAGNARWRGLGAPLYAFGRLAHDFADDPTHRDDPCLALDAWEELLVEAFHGTAAHPIFVGLAHATRELRLPLAPFMDLLASFRVEARGQPPTTEDELIHRCRLGPGAVGRIIVQALGRSNPATMAWAEDLAIALRLVDFVVDLPRDVARGQLHWPVADFLAFGVDPSSPWVDSPAGAELVAMQVARARLWLARARPLLRVLHEPVLATLWRTAERRLDRVATQATFGPPRSVRRPQRQHHFVAP